MPHAPSLAAPGHASRRRAKNRPVAAAEERLRPARGIMLGLGLSSALWAALVAVVFG